MLPDLVDPEGNDVPEVYIDRLEQQENKYPPFLTFDYSRNTIYLMPDD